ncbi:MAG: hypothetical protein JRJ37_10165, partial [Deltaproteobacteria bacterium]|nr:hypothetical protein [Deltaproteobacteria bacterium]
MVQRILTVLLSGVVLLVAACANFGHQAATRTPDATFEKQLLEANRKIAQLDQRVAMLQVMVDNQQRTLYELRKLQTEKTDPVRKIMPVAPRIKIGNEPVDKPPAVETEEKTPVVAREAAKSPAAPIDKTADAHYAATMAVFQKTDYEKAGDLFDSFV